MRWRSQHIPRRAYVAVAARRSLPAFCLAANSDNGLRNGEDPPPRTYHTDHQCYLAAAATANIFAAGALRAATSMKCINRKSPVLLPSPRGLPTPPRHVSSPGRAPAGIVGGGGGGAGAALCRGIGGVTIASALDPAAAAVARKTVSDGRAAASSPPPPSPYGLVVGLGDPVSDILVWLETYTLNPEP